MPTQTEDEREELHGESQPTPRFGPGSEKSSAGAVSPAGLDKAEQNGGVGSTGTVGTKEKSISDKLGKGFTSGAIGAAAGATGAGKLARAANFFKKRKKKTAAGAIVGTAATLGFISFSVFQGPLQVIHLAETLGSLFSNQDNASELRMRGLVRWAKSGNYGETRLGFMQSEINKRATAKLEKAGITFGTDRITGQFTGDIRIDQQKNSSVSNLSEENAKKRLAAEFGVSEDNVRRISGAGGLDGKGAVFSVSARDAGQAFQRNMIKQAINLAGLSKIASAVSLRPVTTSLGRPSILHPWKKAQAKLEQKTADTLRKKESERQKKVTSRSEGANTRLQKIREKATGTRQAAGGALTIQLGLCVAKEVASEIPQINYEGVVVPSMALGADALAQGSQVKAGDDLASEQPGASVQNYKDSDGKTIWEGKALQALQNKKNLSGEDLDNGYKQAFSPNSSAAEVEKALDAAGGAFLCSPAGIAGGVALGAVAIVTAAPSGGLSVAAYAAGVGASVAATTVAINALTSFLPKLIADEAPPVTELTGPAGGNLAAWGTKALANTSYMSSGGAAISKNESTELAAYNWELEQEELKSKSFAERVFDPYYKNSLFAQVITNQSFSIGQNIGSMSGLFASPANFFSGLPSLISPKASAVSSSYDWGDFRDMAFTKAELMDPRYNDNWNNANESAKILERTGDRYIEKAKTCFGVKLEKGDKGWDAIKDPELIAQLNPASAKYQDANCPDRDNEDWTRIRFFIFDTQLAKGDECYSGDDKEICQELGAAQQVASDESTQTEGEDPSIVDGSVQELASKLLEYKEEGKYACTNAEDCKDLELMKEGESIDCSKNPCQRYQACQVNALDKRVLQLLIYLIEKGYKIGTYALCRSHSQTGGVHDDGLALDISSVNGKSLLDSSSKQDALEVAKTIFELNNELKAKQIITDGVAKRHDPDFTKYNRSRPGAEGASAGFDGDTLAGHRDHIHVGY